MKTYVVGFLFNAERSRLVLIHKKHGPACVVGRWNGVGGKIESGESPFQAMVREFQEETGVTVLTWKHFCTFTSETATVYFFDAVDTRAITLVRSTTDEEIAVFGTRSFPAGLVVPNLTWMIPFLCDQTTVHDLGDVKIAEDPVV